MTQSISKRFHNGLSKYNISLDNLKKRWKYCGGELGRHLNYYNLCCKGEKMPEHEDRCICGHRIKENCYITDGEYILTLGNCCVKRFLPYNTRTCERCNKMHRNRKDNLCIKCRKGFFRTENKIELRFD
jgi:uracil-DNA glycosylase